MKILIPTTRYRKNLKRISKRGKNPDKLLGILACLERDEPLPASARPHLLQGKWSGYWECHIEPNWLLVYKVYDDRVELARTGTHADLFE